MPEEEIDLVAFIDRRAKREQREADQIEYDLILRELIEDVYEPLPAGASFRGGNKSGTRLRSKAFASFAGKWKTRLGGGGDDLHIGNAPLKAASRGLPPSPQT